MDKQEFFANNSKIQILYLLIPSLIIFSSFTYILFYMFDKVIIIFCVVFLIASIILMLTSIYFFFQPKTAIETKDDEIFFYKRNRIYKFTVNEIEKVLINIGWGSFDTKIYTICGKKKSFHFFIIKSTKKKREYIKYFNDRNIKIITYNLNF